MTHKPSPPSPARSRKLPKRFTPVAFAFFMAGIMALLMCSVIVGVTTGVNADFLFRVGKAYALAMPVAFFCVMLVRPLVLKLVALTVHS